MRSNRIRRELVLAIQCEYVQTDIFKVLGQRASILVAEKTSKNAAINAIVLSESPLADELLMALDAQIDEINREFTRLQRVAAAVRAFPRSIGLSLDDPQEARWIFRRTLYRAFGVAIPAAVDSYLELYWAAFGCAVLSFYFVYLAAEFSRAWHLVRDEMDREWPTPAVSIKDP